MLILLLPTANLPFPYCYGQTERGVQAPITPLIACQWFCGTYYCLPLGQLSGSAVAAWLQAIPAGQGRQVLAPGIGLKVPGSQGSSSPVPAGQ